MANAASASGRWTQLDGARQGFIRRCEMYAMYTLPKVCPPDNYDQNSTELSHDFQAVGAQAVNHLANQNMLALFAPSRPFFRAEPDAKTEGQIEAAGLDEVQVQQILAEAEKKAVTRLDRMGLRPKLYEVLKNLIVVGNVLLVLDEKSTRVIGVKSYCTRRSASGELLEIIIADKVRFDELDDDVRTVAKSWAHYQEDTEVTHYRWIKRNTDGDFEMTQWVNQQQLPKEFNGKWPEHKLPYRVLTWDLTDGAHYGTSLVEDYRADFAGLSALSRAQVVGAVLASEFRWLVNPAGMTKAEDFEQSANGAAIPGNEGDIRLIESSKSTDLQVTLNMSAEYVNRIGRGFLLGSTQIRQAERVTREEVRLVANELETALGGAYSRLALDIQLPMAYWLMDLVGLTLDGSGFTPHIVTGLEALSRTGDLEELKLWLSDMAALQQLPETLQAGLNMGAIATALAVPRRITVDQFVKPPEQVAQEQAARREQQLEDQAAASGMEAGAKGAIKAQEGQAT